MTDKSKNPTPRPIFDVSHPSKTKALATSKPVLVANRTIIKDPMMSASLEPTSESGTEPARVLDKITITPLSAPIISKPEKVSAEVSPEAPASQDAHEPEPSEPTLEDKETSNLETTESKAEEPTEKTTDEDKDPESNVDSSKASATNDPLDLEKAALEQAKEEAELQKLIDSKKYFLNIETTENRKAKRFIALSIVLSLILALAWADIALDAGLIHLSGVKSLTHFFSN